MGGSSPSLPSLACDLGVSLRVVVVVPPRDAMKEERKKHTHKRKGPAGVCFAFFCFLFLSYFSRTVVLLPRPFFPSFF